MKTFVGINNIEHFADQLTSGVEPTKRATLVRLLVEEEDRMGAGFQQLGVAELRITAGERLIAKQKSLIAKLDGNGHDSRQANDLLGSLIEVQALFMQYRRTIMSCLDRGVI